MIHLSNSSQVIMPKAPSYTPKLDSINNKQEAEMTCLLNYTPEEQSELQWLANEAAVQHSWAEDSHESVFSSQTGHLKALQLADRLQDTLWAMSLVRSRTFSDTVNSLLLL